MPAKKTHPTPPPAEIEKASEQIHVRIPDDLKKKLTAALKDHPFFKGNTSEFMNECARALVLQTRRGKRVAFPLEFVEE